MAGRTTLVYNADNQVINQYVRGTGAAPLVSYTYSYDALDRLTVENRNNVLKTFTYDSTSQVTNDSTKAYSYDANGNRNMTNYSTGVHNRTTGSVEGAANVTYTYSYNDLGNVTRRTTNSSGAYLAYSYDHRNQLTAVEERTGGGALVSTITLVYDAYGNLLSKNNAGTVTKYAYEITDTRPGVTKSVHELWAELNSANAVTTRYMSGAKEGDVAARAIGSTVNWLGEDRLGSVREIQSNTGTLVRQISYDGFGNVISSTGTGSQGNILFGGYTWHDDTNLKLYNMHWRWYNSGNGQWTSEDPIGFAAGDYNTRRYVGNGSTIGVDPSGLLDKTVGRYVIVATGGSAGSSVMVHPMVIAAVAIGVGIYLILDQAAKSQNKSKLQYMLDNPVKSAHRMDTIGPDEMPDFSKVIKPSALNPFQYMWKERANANQQFEAQFARREAEFLRREAEFKARLVREFKEGKYDDSPAEIIRSMILVRQQLATKRKHLNASNDPSSTPSENIFLRNGIQKEVDLLAQAEAQLQERLDKLNTKAKQSEEDKKNKKPCFTASTPIRTPDGHKLISYLQVGDLVLSRNEFDPNDRVVEQTVEEIFVSTGPVWNLHVGGHVIQTAPEHPFYVHEKGWTACFELQIGDLIATENGVWLPVEDLFDTGEWQTLFNFRVSDSHTYFVGRNDWAFSIWAHNTCVMLYKAPQNAFKAARLLTIGFTVADFSYPGGDNSAYLAKNDKSLADAYAFQYGAGVLAITVPEDDYNANLKRYESLYQGGPQIEVIVPHSAFPILNKYPRSLLP